MATPGSLTAQASRPCKAWHGTWGAAPTRCALPPGAAGEPRGQRPACRRLLPHADRGGRHRAAVLFERAAGVCPLLGVPPVKRVNGYFDLQNKVIEMEGGSGPQWCVRSGPLPWAGETSMPGEATPVTLGGDAGMQIPLETFEFVTAGEHFSQACLASNGCLASGSTSCALWRSDDTPTAAAAFKADLDPSSGGNIAYWEVPRDLW